jgi:hypothetical protein
MEAKDKKSKKKEEVEEEGSEEEEEEETFETHPALLEKYKTAATISNDALKYVISLCAAGADIAEICMKGDKKIEELVLQGFTSFYRSQKYTQAKNAKSQKKELHSQLASVSMKFVDISPH